MTRPPEDASRSDETEPPRTTVGSPLPPPSRGGPSRAEVGLVLALLAAAFVVRVIAVFRYSFDSDEWQHLHVAWAYGHGFMPYRDVFDNHTPLFHLAMAPLVAAVGERAEIHFIARFAMFPIYALTLWATFSIGRAIASLRVGLWSAAFLALHAEFFRRSIEFRTDDLWALLWMLSVRALVVGSSSPRRGFVAGLWLGAAFGVSLKTSALALGLFGGTAILPLVSEEVRGAFPWRRTGIVVGSCAGGSLVIPAILLIGAALAGILPDLYECTIGHNLRGGVLTNSVGLPRATFLPFAAILVGLAAAFARIRGASGDRARQALLLLVFGLATLATYVLWPNATTQSVLPLHPLLALAVAFALTECAAAGTAFVARRRGGGPAAPGLDPVLAVAILALVGGGETVRLLAGHPLGQVRTSGVTARLAEVLRLTDRSDFVMDAKGEAIFRPRPYYPVLETLTRDLLKSGQMGDRIAARLVETRTCVAEMDLSRFPPAATAFIEHAYVPAGQWRVAGHILDGGAAQSGPIPFDVEIPAVYVIVSETGPVRGKLDGTPIEGPRLLRAGRHEVVPATGTGGRVAFVWAQALERGFSPFGPGQGRP